jgi:hypothetical protein
MEGSMSTTPQQRLESDLKAAMKARDRPLTDTLRMLLSAVKNRRIELGAELGEQDFAALVRKAIKQREEAATQYRQGGRVELAEKEEGEKKLLAAYLPPEVDEDQIRQAVDAYVREHGLSGVSAMGVVMKAMNERFAGAVDGKKLSSVVREQLQR